MITANRPISPEQVASHYDELDRFYRKLWGRHVHHGLWQTGRESPRQAVEQLVEAVARPLHLSSGMHVCDVGCGYGETSRYLVERHGVRATGITLSAAQHEFACRANQDSSNPDFLLGDWTKNRLSDNSFDSLFSIECLAHVVDKPAFFEQIRRVLKPGGRAVITAWLEGDQSTDWQRRWLLEPICREGRLPSMGQQREYSEMARRAGLTVREFRELGPQVRKTWKICSRRVFTHLATRPDAWWYLIRRQGSSWMFLFSIWRIRMAYRTGAMGYGLFVMEKPGSSESIEQGGLHDQSRTEGQRDTGPGGITASQMIDDEQNRGG